jgi:hypothetical protein
MRHHLLKRSLACCHSVLLEVEVHRGMKLEMRDARCGRLKRKDIYSGWPGQELG